MSLLDCLESNPCRCGVGGIGGRDPGADLSGSGGGERLDITPNNGIDDAIPKILELGGTLKKHPSLYPRPAPDCDEAPVLDWAVMQDPFGNEFCLVYDLTDEQSTAALDAARNGVLDDHAQRVDAGQATS